MRKEILYNKKEAKIPKYIFISGKKGHGKNLLATKIANAIHGIKFNSGTNVSSIADHPWTIVRQKHPQSIHGYSTKHTRQVSFAKPIKDIAQKLFLFDRTQIEGTNKEIVDPKWGLTPREIMQGIGTKMREIDPDIFVKLLIENMRKPNITYIITDCRFKNEVELTKAQLYNTFYIRINRPGLAPNQFSNHISETDLDDWRGFDSLVTNTSKSSVNDVALRLMLQWVGIDESKLRQDIQD